MSVKLLMSWDIKSGREQEYFEFVIREWVPGLQRMGIEPSEAYYTMYGNGPQILAGGLADSLPAIRALMASAEWRGLKEQLLGYVDNYSEKVVPAKGGFQL